MPFSDWKIKPEIGKNACGRKGAEVAAPTARYFTSWHQPWRSGSSPYWMPWIVS